MLMKKRETMENNDGNDVYIPAELVQVFEEIVGLTDEFCREHLNEEYRRLCHDMVLELVELEIAIDRGRPTSWAAGVVHAAGYVNFLHDPSQSPHMTSSEISKGFGISQGTMQSKSKIIRDELDLMPFDPDWCLESLLDDNPLVWMLDVDGLAVDIRMAPRDVQEEAYRQGLIPYIPAVRKKPQSQPDQGTRIIQFRAGQSASKRSDKAKDESPTLF